LRFGFNSTPRDLIDGRGEHRRNAFSMRAANPCGLLHQIALAGSAESWRWAYPIGNYSLGPSGTWEALGLPKPGPFQSEFADVASMLCRNEHEVREKAKKLGVEHSASGARQREAPL
jgi:hypothetical protein